MTELAWRSICEKLASGARAAGFDLLQPFGVAHYNDAATTAEQLDSLGQRNPLGVLFANTRELWPAFTRAYAADPEVAAAAHPLDAYVVSRLSAVVANATIQRTGRGG